MRALRFVVAGVTAALLAGALASAALAGQPWGPETPPFNIEVILRDDTGGGGFGLVKFRQPNDDSKVVGLDTRVRGLEPNRDYLLQRAADPADGSCTSTAWLTLGMGLTPQAIATDDRGVGTAALFRDLALLPTGARFDIRFRVIDAATGSAVLESDCYVFAVSP
jgi:hypothetical protein